MKPFDIRDILPDGFYEVLQGDKTLAKFKTYQEARGFIVRSGVEGLTLKHPDLRSKMKPDEIAAAEFFLRQWGKTGPL